MRRSLLFPILAFCAAAALFLRIYPLVVIQPFAPQAPGPLQQALFVFRIAPIVSALLAALAVSLTAWAWRNLRRVSRIGASVLALVTCATAVLARINVFELMFHPAGAPRFVTTKEAKIDPDDMLIAIAFNGDAHAYPIREMGYHHVVNDFAGGVPIVATY